MVRPKATSKKDWRFASKTSEAPSTLRGPFPSIVAMSRQRSQSTNSESSCTPTNEQRMGTVLSVRLAEVAMTRLSAFLGLASTGTPGDAGVAGRSSDARSTRKLSYTSLPTDQVSVGYRPSGSNPRGTLRLPSAVEMHRTKVLWAVVCLLR